jgi:hypothetical protein
VWESGACVCRLRWRARVFQNMSKPPSTKFKTTPSYHQVTMNQVCAGSRYSFPTMQPRLRPSKNCRVKRANHAVRA